MNVIGRIWRKLTKQERLQQLEEASNMPLSIKQMKQIGVDYFIAVVEHV